MLGLLLLSMLFLLLVGAGLAALIAIMHDGIRLHSKEIIILLVAVVSFAISAIFSFQAYSKKFESRTIERTLQGQYYEEYHATQYRTYDIEYD